MSGFKVIMLFNQCKAVSDWLCFLHSTSTKTLSNNKSINQDVKKRIVRSFFVP